jgi:hypothetical protein
MGAEGPPVSDVDREKREMLDELLTALGMGTHARPESSAAVWAQAITRVKSLRSATQLIPVHCLVSSQRGEPHPIYVTAAGVAIEPLPPTVTFRIATDERGGTCPTCCTHDHRTPVA